MGIRHVRCMHRAMRVDTSRAKKIKMIGMLGSMRMQNSDTISNHYYIWWLEQVYTTVFPLVFNEGFSFALGIVAGMI